MAIKPRDNTIPPINDGKSNRRHGTISGFTVVVVVVVGVVVGVVAGVVVGSAVVVFVGGAEVVVGIVVGIVVLFGGTVVVSFPAAGTTIVVISGAGAVVVVAASGTVPFLISSFAAKAKCPFAIKNAITNTQVVWNFIVDRLIYVYFITLY